MFILNRLTVVLRATLRVALGGIFWGVAFLPLEVQSAETRDLVSVAVAQVQDNIITSREVQANHLMEWAIRDSDSRAEYPGLIKIGSKDFKKRLSQVTTEWMVYLEAQQFESQELSSEEISRSLKRIRSQLKDKPEWVKLKITDRERSKMLHRKLRAKKFIQFKSKTSRVSPTDKEAKRYYQNNKEKFGGLPFENFKENIRTFLSQRQVNKRLRSWLQILHSKYRVQFFLESGEGSPGQSPLPPHKSSSKGSASSPGIEEGDSQ